MINLDTFFVLLLVYLVAFPYTKTIYAVYSKAILIGTVCLLSEDKEEQSSIFIDMYGYSDIHLLVVLPKANFFQSSKNEVLEM